MTRACRLPLISVIVLFAVNSSAAHAQTPKIPFELDTHAFRHTVWKAGFETRLHSVTEITNPAATLVILLGKTDMLERLPNGCREFISRGGALLVATDNRDEGLRLDAPFGVMIVDEARLPAHLAAKGYRGLQDCPFVEPLSNNAVPIFSGVPNKVATNRPGFFQYRHPGSLPRGLTDVATIWVEARGFLPRGLGTGPRTFAIGGELGDGRVLLLSDHSVFLNDMMLQRDNGNLAFAANCLAWLAEGKTKRRSQVLYVEEGTVRTDLEIHWKTVTPPIPQPPDVLAVADQLIAGLEDEDFFNHVLFSAIPFSTLLKSLAAALTVAALVYGWTRVSKARHRHEQGVPLLPQALTQLAPAGLLVEQRHQAMLKSGNFWEAGRELALACFDDAAVIGDRPDVPAFQIRGGWWRRHRLGSKVCRLWRLAYDDNPERLSPRGFARVARTCDEVKAALADGTLRFDELTTDGPTA